MSDYMRRARRQDGKTSGGTVLNILMFFGGALLILVIVVSFQKRAQGPLPSSFHPEDFDNAPQSSAGVSDDDYVKRGLMPNKGAANTTQKTSIQTPPMPAETKYIGETEFKMYHRPDCKTLKYIEEKARVPFASAADAFARGFIPCKVCRPEVPTASAGNSDTVKSKTTPKTGAKTASKTPKTVPTDTGPKPVSLPIKDVDLSFPFSVKGRDVVNERGCIRVEYEVDVQKPLQQGDVLLLTQKLVAQETAKGPINCLSLIVHTDPKSASMIKWIGSADWAPWGNLTRANEMKAGDYTNHQFSIGPFQGFFNPKGK